MNTIIDVLYWMIVTLFSPSAGLNEIDEELYDDGFKE